MRKGQLQIKESVLVIFVFTFLFIFGLILFYQYTAQNIEDSVNEYEEGKFRQLIAYIPSMAELKCSRFNVEEECIDVMKMEAFMEISNEYRDEFGNKNITIREVFLEKDSWEIYSNIPFDRNGDVLKISTPVSLYYPDKKEYGVGVLEIRWYV